MRAPLHHRWNIAGSVPDVIEAKHIGRLPKQRVGRLRLDKTVWLPLVRLVIENELKAPHKLDAEQRRTHLKAPTAGDAANSVLLESVHAEIRHHMANPLSQESFIFRVEEFREDPPGGMLAPREAHAGPSHAAGQQIP